MATFLDVTGLQAFSKIFVLLIVVLVMYIILAQLKIIGDKHWIAWLIAIPIGILVLLSDLLTGLISSITPWFAVLFIFIIFVTMASQIFGATTADVAQYKWILFLVIIVIFVVGALTYVRKQTSVPGDRDPEGNEIIEEDYVTTSNFIFHPKVMGIILILLVAIFTVALLAGKAS